MQRSDCETEMLQGYWDGLWNAPEPGSNRSHSYRHGWKNGRDDRAKSPRAATSYIRDEAEQAIKADMDAALLTLNF